MLLEVELQDWIAENWPFIVTFMSTILSLIAASHAILWKRDVRSALGWAGLILFSPFIGVVLYFLLGINRVKRKAIALRLPRERLPWGMADFALEPTDLAAQLKEKSKSLTQIAKTVASISPRPLLYGNSFQILRNGEEAFPAMLETIRQARHSITLQTYIFGGDSLGRMFIDELVAAQERGVAVRVLIDAFGGRYSYPFAYKLLADRGIQVAIFIPFRRITLLNLRTHRKILVVDGHIAFTGGMNLRRNHLIGAVSSEPTADLHFRIEGPLVSQLQEVFVEDWAFTTSENLHGSPWFAEVQERGPVIARGIADGPDENFHAMMMTFHAAIASAQKGIRIMTPYFLPDLTLCTALRVAAARGIDVDIIIPRRGNLKLVQWATWAQLWQVVDYGCRVWLSGPYFEHTKLMTVDGHWAAFGSTNWDSRSLRLNFEINIEAYDKDFVSQLDTFIDERIASAERLSSEQLRQRTLPVRLRDAVARLMAPYL